MKTLVALLLHYFFYVLVFMWTHLHNLWFLLLSVLIHTHTLIIIKNNPTDPDRAYTTWLFTRDPTMIWQMFCIMSPIYQKAIIIIWSKEQPSAFLSSYHSHPSMKEFLRRSSSLSRWLTQTRKEKQSSHSFSISFP